MEKKFKFIRGLSLIEFIIYLAIFIAVIGTFTAYFTGILKIGNRESSSDELSSQLNSVMLTIKQKVQSSSNIDVAAQTPTSFLKLRMKDPVQDPTCIFLNNGKVQIAEGPATSQKQNCTSTVSDLTTDKVIVDSLSFSKKTFYPGHDQVFIDLQMTYNSTNPEKKISRAIRTAISRVYAATFEDNLLPSNDNVFDIGNAAGVRWRNAYFSGSVGIGSINPGAALEIIPPAASPSWALRLKRTSLENGSVDLFAATGTGTGTAVCQATSGNALCLGYWASDGTLSTCGTSKTNGRALCADFGD